VAINKLEGTLYKIYNNDLAPNSFITVFDDICKKCHTFKIELEKDKLARTLSDRDNTKSAMFV
jgi:hypothetical protein